jgi:hypothetical protein
MSIDEYFHKTLFASIIVGPALAMTLPLAYWVQYQHMLLFPSLLYYVVATACISAMLYFFLYVVPDNWRKRKKKLLMLPYYPSNTSREDNSPTIISNTAEPIIEKEPDETAEPIIYNKVIEEPPTLSPSSPNAINQAQQEESTKYKNLFYAFVDKHVKGIIPDEDANILLDDIYLAVDNRLLELNTTGLKPHLPYTVKATSKFSSLVTEDIYHIGFVVKFFLKKRNEYGAAFIKEVFPHQLKDVEFSTVATKLASSESKNLSIPIPEVCWGDNRSISKRFSGRITEELIKQI